jgi:hypothetical protein
MSLFTISRPIPLDAPVTIATLGLPESVSVARPPDEVDLNVMDMAPYVVTTHQNFLYSKESKEN